MTARPASPTRQTCDALALRLGVTLEYQWTRSGQHVDIYVPPGPVGSPGLDALRRECELDEDIWPGVYADLRVIDAPPPRRPARRSR